MITDGQATVITATVSGNRVPADAGIDDCKCCDCQTLMTSAISTPRATTPADIVAFWRAAGPERWYEKDDAFDARGPAPLPVRMWQDAAAGEPVRMGRQSTKARWR